MFTCMKGFLSFHHSEVSVKQDFQVQGITDSTRDYSDLGTFYFLLLNINILLCTVLIKYIIESKYIKSFQNLHCHVNSPGRCVNLQSSMVRYGP